MYMNIGLFQLLPRPEDRSDREVLDQALWEADFAERNGFESVWIAEHHYTAVGLIGAPSVYAAAIASRSKRIRIGYGVAVLPLHHPLRLAEEIGWLDLLSGGRMLVGVGPGFNEPEFKTLGASLADRHAQTEERLTILRSALSGEKVSEDGMPLRPRPVHTVPILRACSSSESIRRAAQQRLPIMLPPRATNEVAELLKHYRHSGASDDDVASAYVLRKLNTTAASAMLDELAGLHELGIRHVIAWLHHDGVEHERVRRSMELVAAEVLPRFQCTLAV
jgi:alkanesulfonate monooxygenase SsuD/methylene tetrahydromethanopterin reductase-like flavin-dependent oxidoreductase (luciferase family)